MTAKINRILVPTDFSETADQALRYASGLARGLGAKLTIVYADPFVPPVDFSATVGAWDEFSFISLQARAQDHLRIAAEANVDPSVAYDIGIRVDPPLDGILAEARASEADLIVMGTHGRTGFRRLIIGSVTEAVMRYAKVPVIAVPAHIVTSSPIRTIVCPVIDETNLDALTFAASIASPDAHFIVIRAMVGGEASESADEVIALRGAIPAALVSRCELKLLGDEHAGNQIEGLAKTAHADLIVAAEPAGRSTSDLLRGTFAARLVQNSECPVLTINELAAKAAARTVEQEARVLVCATR
ncbi:MAG TPA: universal stress protein [Thermoanaerobaculia bacterium]|jgi:nucleotide-binding universal stress UspA family protein|nr:universal stress protein [Thermoanaerobaculia bacterium]